MTPRSHFLPSLTAKFDALVSPLLIRRRRLIGLSLLRILLGGANVLYYVSDYGRREFFWGPHSYNSPKLAEGVLSHGTWSLYFVSNSNLWFEVVFHAGLAIALLFTIFGGRWLTLLQAVFLWSLYNRNQDILEGGDNLARILILFMLLCVSNAYFSPGAKARRQRLLEAPSPSGAVLAHNLGAALIVFQVAEVYFTAGYSKIIGSVWQNGTAMYYISREVSFQQFGIYPWLMSSPFLGTFVSYMTIGIEMAFPFAILSRRAWIRRVETILIEGMHAGIIVFMGLVCFGLIMIGADCTVLRDEDYAAAAAIMRRHVSRRLPRVRRLISVSPEVSADYDVAA